MRKVDLGYQDDEYPRGGCLPLTVVFFLAILVFGGLLLFGLWWFSTPMP